MYIGFVCLSLRVRAYMCLCVRVCVRVFVRTCGGHQERYSAGGMGRRQASRSCPETFGRVDDALTNGTKKNTEIPIRCVCVPGLLSTRWNMTTSSLCRMYELSTVAATFLNYDHVQKRINFKGTVC